jgi:hypothetical protein
VSPVPDDDADDNTDDVDTARADGPWGVVPLVGRGSLPFESLHGVPLWLHALTALAEVVTEPVVLVGPTDRERVEKACRRLGPAVRVTTEDAWPDVVRRFAGRPLVVHDPLCPLVPHDVLADFCRRGSEQPGTSYVAYRPVTDTVKTAVDGRIEGTIDREGLAALTSPVLVVAAMLDGALPLRDAGALLRGLRARGVVELVMAPSIARRVDDVSAVHLLECVDELERRLRHGAALSDGRAPRTP